MALNILERINSEKRATGREITAVWGFKLLVMNNMATLAKARARLQKTAGSLSFQYKVPKTMGKRAKFRLAREKPRERMFR